MWLAFACTCSTVIKTIRRVVWRKSVAEAARGVYWTLVQYTQQRRLGNGLISSMVFHAVLKSEQSLRISFTQADAFRDPNQLGQRIDFHLFHNARAVNLDGLLDRPKLVGDLFVEHPRDH